MIQALRKAGRSLPLILLLALALRVGFAWNETRHLPPSVRGTAPFLNETSNIARSLALGHGFSDVFRRNTGPTAWLTPVYPLLVAGVFRMFGVFTPGSFYAVAGLNILFFAATCIPIFLWREKDRRKWSGKRGSLAVGGVSQCRYYSVRVGVGYVAFSPAGSHHFAGDAAIRGTGAASGMVRLWRPVGTCLDDQSRAGFRAGVPAGLARSARST